MTILLFYYALLGAFAITSVVAAPTGHSPPPQLVPDQSTQNRPALPDARREPTVKPTKASPPQVDNVPTDGPSAWQLLSDKGGGLGEDRWHRVIPPDAPGFKWPQVDDVINFKVIDKITGVAYSRLQRSIGSSVGLVHERNLVKNLHLYIKECTPFTRVDEISGMGVMKAPLRGYWTISKDFWEKVGGFTTIWKLVSSYFTGLEQC
jgi:hypothetical protein